MARCALYLTEKESEPGLRELAEDKRLNIVKVYQEPSPLSTSALMLMLASARRANPPFKAVLVNDWSAVGELPGEGLIYKSLLEQQGLATYSRDPVADDGSLELLNGLVRIIDRYYLSSISAGTIKGMKKNIAEHNENGGKPPYGYSHTKVVVGFENEKEIVKTRLQLDQDEAPRVKEIFELYLAGKSYDEIANYLNEQGIPPRSASKWRKSSIRAILVNQVYYGCRVWNQYDKKGKGGRVKPESEWVILENNHDAIISKEMYLSVQERRGSRWGEKKTSENDYSLGSLLRCGHCQRPLFPANDGLATFWLCEASRGRQTACSNKGLINNLSLERRVYKVIKEVFFTPANARKLSERLSLPNQSPRQLLNLAKKLLATGSLAEKQALSQNFIKEIQLFDEKIVIHFCSGSIPIEIPIKNKR